MRAILLSVLVLGAACTPPPARPLAALAPLPAAPPAAAPSATAAAPAPSAPAPLPPCHVDPLPTFAAPVPPGACAAVPAGPAARTRARLTKRYTPGAPGDRLVVTFACDPLAGPPSEIVIEDGSGHGQNLTLVRLRRRGGTVEALRLAFQGESFHSGPGDAFAVERGSVPASALDAILPAARALVLARLEERPRGDDAARSGFFSSGDFHGLLRLQDAAGHVMERAFTGYPSSEEQFDSMPMAEIGELLFDLLDKKIRWAAAPIDADARAFFTWRYLAAGLTPPPGRATWWVRERLVTMAETVGTPALIPSLLELSSTEDQDASVERTRAEAVTSLAALTGFDVRKDAQGAARKIEEAAADYRRACTP